MKITSLALFLVLTTHLLEAQPAPKLLTAPTSVGPYLLLETETLGVQVRWLTYPAMETEMEYGPTPGAWSAVKVEGQREAHLISLPLGASRQVWYRVKLPSGWSQGYHVALPDYNQDELNYLVLGDMQDAGVLQPPRRWADVARASLDKALELNAGFLVFTGDMTEDDHPGYWKSFFDKGDPLLARFPSVAVPGNHDSPQGTRRGKDYAGYSLYFPGALHRGFTAGPGGFLMLNTEVTALDTLDQDQTQVGFAREFLDRSRAKPWVGAFFHYPPYHAMNRHQDSLEKTREFTREFDGKTDIVFTGHVHAYQRTIPISFPGKAAPSGQGRETDQGPVYVVVPPAGNWPEPYSRLVPDSPEGLLLAFPPKAGGRFIKENSDLGFITVEMTTARLKMSVYGLGDLSSRTEAPLRLVDQVEFTK